MADFSKSPGGIFEKFSSRGYTKNTPYLLFPLPANTNGLFKPKIIFSK